MHPGNLSIKEFTYDLPPDRIAKYPLPQRDESKLLIASNNELSDDIFKNLDNHLPPGSLMLFNDTKVVQARLLFRKKTGAHIEVFCLEPAREPFDIQMAFQVKKTTIWKCLLGNAKKWKEGNLTLRSSNGLELQASIVGKKNDEYLIEFTWNSDNVSFAALLEEMGKTPLPPYINRTAEQNDKIRYQTIFARESGSVAAPTAALHFTPEVMEKMNNKNIITQNLTLHVGAGTFKPVSSETIDQHNMHREQIVISRKALERIRDNHDKSIISVGTTSLRTIETLYWVGVKMINGYKPHNHYFFVEQWEAYDIATDKTISGKNAIEQIIAYMEQHNLHSLQGETALIIAPGYRVMMADILITNFHQPQSTLLLLVAAFYGSHWKKIYNYALENNFRFLSYGDSCLIYKNKNKH